MTTKTDSFPTVQNPLSGHWATTYGGLQCTASGIVKGTSPTPQDNLSSWSTSDYTFLNDQTSQITFSNIGDDDWPGATVRIAGTTTSSTGYVAYARLESTGIFLYKIATSGTIGAGSANEIGSATGLTLTGSHTMQLAVAGTNLIVYLDGSSIITVSDSAFTAGQPGIAYEFGNNNSTQINSFTATDAGGGSNTGITPAVGAVTTAGNTPTVTPASSTVISPLVARKSGLLMPSRRLLIPTTKKIFLPPVRKAA